MTAGKNTTDHELLKRIASKDRSAVQVLFARHHLALYRFLVRLVRNEAVAEELVNETFVEVWRSAARFKGRSAPSTWIFAIARNKAVSILRKRADEELDDHTSLAVEDESDNPEVTAMKGNKAKLICQCLEKLSPQHREVIDLVYYHEKSINEIATITGLPPGTVKTRVFHARKQLTGLLKRAGIDRGWP